VRRTAEVISSAKRIACPLPCVTRRHSIDQGHVKNFGNIFCSFDLWVLFPSYADVILSVISGSSTTAPTSEADQGDLVSIVTRLSKSEALGIIGDRRWLCSSQAHPQRSRRFRLQEPNT
jgi:hypothetical protein